MQRTSDNVESDSPPSFVHYAAMAALWFIALFVVVYLGPLLIESLLRRFIGLWGTIAIEDLTGCLILGLYWGLRPALLLYGGLKVVELALVRGAVVTPVQLNYFGDAVPTLIVLGFAAVFAFKLRPDRSDLERGDATAASRST